MLSGVLACWLCGVTDASAANVRWSAPNVLVGNAAQADDYAVAAAAGGERVAAWIDASGVFASVARPGQDFAAPQRVAGLASPIPGRLVAVDDRGDAVVVWTLANATRASGLYASYMPAGGVFGAPKRITGNGIGADFGLDGGGVATFAWWSQGARGRTTLEIVDWVRGDRLAGRQALATGRALRDLAIAVNRRGDAVVSWVSGSLAQSAVECAARVGGRRFSRSFDVSGAAGVSDPSVDLAADRALIAWDGRYTGASSGSPYQEVDATAVGIRSRTVGPVQRLLVHSRGGLVETGPLVRADPRGDAIVVFETYGSSGTSGTIHVARSRGSRRLRLTSSFLTDEPSQEVNAAIAPNGGAVVAWSNLSRPDEATTTPNASAPFSKPHWISSPRRDADAPAVALDARGDATALWWDLGPSSPTTPGSQETPLLYATIKLS